MPLTPNWPTSLDSLANPSESTYVDDTGFFLDEVIARIHDLLELMEVRFGTGASTPIANSVYVGTGTGTTAYLAGLTNAYIAAAAAIAPTKIATVPYCRAYKNTTAQSISNGSETAVTLNAETTDTDVIHDDSTNNSRLTCKTAGTYLIAGSLEFAGATGGIRDVYLRIGGSTRIATGVRAESPTASGSPLAVVGSWVMAVNDYVEMTAFQNQGGAVNVNAGSGATFLAMARVGT